MTFVLPPKSKVGYLAPEIAGEGQRVIHSDGSVEEWQEPAPRSIYPDFSHIKSIRHYFNRTGPVRLWPSWLYHPTEAPRIVKSEEEAAALGVVHRETTHDEKARMNGLQQIWEYDTDCLWRTQPYPANNKRDVTKEMGKNIVYAEVNQQAALAKSFSEFAASMKQSTGASPAATTSKEWAEFEQFRAWKASLEAPAPQPDITPVESIAEPTDDDMSLNALTIDQERAMWETEAKRIGLKIDGRWSLVRLREEVEKAA
jgi:hypothetical protein